MLAWLALAAHAQHMGQLRVVVVDSVDDLPVPAVMLSLTGETLIGGVQEKLSDANGESLFTPLTPGVYQLGVTGLGSRVTVEGIVVNVNRTTQQVVQLGGRPIPAPAPQQEAPQAMKRSFLPPEPLDAPLPLSGYEQVRHSILSGQLPSEVRVQDLVDAFRYTELAATDRTALELEAAAHPWRDDRVLLSVRTQGRALQSARAPAHVVALVDLSASMASADKLPLLQYGLHQLVDEMEPQDQLAIVTYGGHSGLAQSWSGQWGKPLLKGAIDALSTGGTPTGDPWALAYELLSTAVGHTERHLVLLTDGDPGGDAPALLELAEERAEIGQRLSVVDVGAGDRGEALLAQLARRGGGAYHHVSDRRAAQALFGRELLQPAEMVAQDMELELFFPEEQVLSWRQIGAQDFRGPVMAGQQKTALYELQLAPGAEGDLVRARLKAGGPQQYERLSPGPLLTPFALASLDLRWAFGVASFAERLRSQQSPSWSQVLALLDARGEAQVELRELALEAASLSGRRQR